jgi:predicted ATPase
MAALEGFRIRNFRSLKDIELGRSWNNGNKALTPLTAVIGKNGVGKSSLFDAFGFLADCLRHGVEEACDMNGRGGIKKIRSMGSSEPIQIDVYYKQDGNARAMTYQLAIDTDENGRPYVKSERLRQRRKGQDRGQPYSFLFLANGEGLVWKGESEGIFVAEDVGELNRINREEHETSESERIQLQDKRKLGIATLGSLKEHPRISAFTQFIESWYLSYFSPDEARGLPLVGPQKHLNRRGDNLANVVQYLEREHKEKLKLILDDIAKKIPGIQSIKTERSPDDRVLLCFNDKGFKDPFYAQQMSDGTLKLFSYMLLIADPDPRPFICIEEPENGLYHKLLEIFASELRNHATGVKGGSGGSQIFITTHQPYLINALKPEEVWILEKQDDGFSVISRASDNELIRDLVAEELPLGNLWYSDYFDKRM